MAKPTELKIQEKIIKYAGEIPVKWTYISQEKMESLRGFDENTKALRAERAKDSSFFCNEIFIEKIKEFNPGIKNPEDILKRILRITPDINGNKEFLEYLKGEKTYHSVEEGRDLNLKLIDFKNIEKNEFTITEEFYCTILNNGKEGNRQDVVLLINGIPIVIVECKNATLENAISIGMKQIRRYHKENPQLLVYQQIFITLDALDLVYGPTWGTNKRNLSFWHNDVKGKLEEKIKSFMEPQYILKLIKDYILYDIKNEELNKYILKQHQVEAVDVTVERCLDKKKNRGLIWHTQGSGKTYTMIKAAQKLNKEILSEKPTILLVLDRNELEDQLMRNIKSLGFENVEKATNIKHINKLLKNDYRGIIVTMIHKFRSMKKTINTRESIYILIDEAHRSTQGDLGNYLVGALPNSTLIGFTGTPTLNKKNGKGTFKTFGCCDDHNYTHKYSIEESIRDNTTLPLFYTLASESGLAVPKEIMENEFFSLMGDEDVSDEEIEAILDKAINLKGFLKSPKRIEKVAELISKHYTNNVQPLGFKAFIVAVDREACVLYKKALDKFLDPNITKVLISPHHNDSREIKDYYINEKDEKKLRKQFTKASNLPEIFIVTEKLLTGYDAPILYCMYLDKPMKNHTLLQAISRINRPYENSNGTEKVQGLVYDLVGVFDEIEKAISFDSENITTVINDINVLREMFKEIISKNMKDYFELITQGFTDKEIDKIIDYFKDVEARNTFNDFYSKLKSLYEYLSPDPFFINYMDKYESLTAIYKIIDKAFNKTVYIDDELVSKTEALLSYNTKIKDIEGKLNGILLDINGIKALSMKKENVEYSNVDLVSIINNIKINGIKKDNNFDKGILYKNIVKIQERFESSKEDINEIISEIGTEVLLDEERKKKYDELGLTEFEYEIYIRLKQISCDEDESLLNGVKDLILKEPNWNKSESKYRDFKLQLMKLFINHAEEGKKDQINDIIKNLKEDFNYIINF